MSDIQQRIKTGNDEIIELPHDFNMDEFQVVRREFFAHLKEPAISFSDCKLFVNSACLSKFPETNYAQILVNQTKKILALRPCDESTRDAFLWCTNNNGKRKPRQSTCRLFFAKLFTLMDWNPRYKYKILGKLMHANGEYLIAFDLTATEVYQRTISEDNKPKTARTPVYPSDWQNQFGLPFNEHKQSLQINIFDGYAIYSLNENTTDKKTEENNTGEI